MWESSRGTLLLGFAILVLNITCYSSHSARTDFYEEKYPSNADLEEKSLKLSKKLRDILPSSALDDLLKQLEKHQETKPTVQTISSYLERSSKVDNLVNKEPAFEEVANSADKNVSASLFVMPEVQTPELTKLITGKEQPTFIHKDAVKPSISTDKNSKVLASYRILVPILVPAVKRKPDTVKLQKEKVEFVTETHTELVPVTKTVVHPKTVVEAERVPQKQILDFVKKGDVQGQEKVIKSVAVDFE